MQYVIGWMFWLYMALLVVVPIAMAVEWCREEVALRRRIKARRTR